MNGFQKFIDIISFLYKIRAMNTSFKHYTFKSQSSHNHSYFNIINNQSNNSPTFNASQRAESLPLKNNFKTTNQTQSFNQLGNSRQRKHRIFEQYKPCFQQSSPSASNKKKKSIFAKYDKGQPQVEAQRFMFQIPKVKQGQRLLQQSIRSPFQCKDLIQKKLAERTNGSAFNAETQIKQRMVTKERQIRYLKMQIERYKRCQIINKQNEDLHKRLAKKLKERTIQNQTNNSKKQHLQDQTPIQSLKQIRFTLGPSGSKAKKHEEKPFQPLQTTPLKVIPEIEENNLKASNKTQPLPKDILVQLITTSNSKQNVQKQSSPKLLSPKRQKDPIYMQIKQKLNEQRNIFKKDINQVPLNSRLKEMNRTLQSNFNAQVSLPLSRPHSQSSQKTRRVEQSLKKSHYVIMMQ